ncbi:MAG: 2-amino-4-hydroxy-6-hydroxymethyldihydropteridine diphosphokinase [Candidatus Neomarinimicrobiota bacterium]
MSEQVFLGLGSNIGDKETNLFSAIAALDLREDCSVIKTASIYETAPLYKIDQPIFLNTVIEITTSLIPEDLLLECQKIEVMLGRPKDHKKNLPRVIDIDILCFKTILVKLPNLEIPHIDLRNRRFVLLPFSEIAPDYIVSGYRKTVRDLLKICPDQSLVKIHNLEKSA